MELVARWGRAPWTDIRERARAGTPPGQTDEVGETGDLGGPDLRGVDLRGAVLERLTWPKVHLELARLDGASFRNSDLRHALFAGASARHACFDHAILENVRFDVACMAGASFLHAKLKSSTITGATFAGCDLRAADLRGVNLSGADLEGAMLFGAKLDRDLSRATATYRWAVKAGCAGFGDVLGSYMSYLSLADARAVRAIEGCVWGSAELERELEVMIDGDWRATLIAAAAIVFVPGIADQTLLERARTRIIKGSWASPQLACALYLLDREPPPYSVADAKAREAIEALHGGDATTQGGKIALRWIERARSAALPEARALWVR